MPEGDRAGGNDWRSCVPTLRVWEVGCWANPDVPRRVLCLPYTMHCRQHAAPGSPWVAVSHCFWRMLVGRDGLFHLLEKEILESSVVREESSPRQGLGLDLGSQSRVLCPCSELCCSPILKKASQLWPELGAFLVGRPWACCWKKRGHGQRLPPAMALAGRPGKQALLPSPQENFILPLRLLLAQLSLSGHLSRSTSTRHHK